MRSVDREYLTSGRFIHDDLLKQAEAAVQVIYGIWKREQRIAPTLFTWPAERIHTDKGEPHEGICLLELPEEYEKRSDALLAMVMRTRAFALLLIEQQRDEVCAIFESSHGARCWRIPITLHGDVAILERARVQDDGAHVGLLWRAQTGKG